MQQMTTTTTTKICTFVVFLYYPHRARPVLCFGFVTLPSDTSVLSSIAQIGEDAPSGRTCCLIGHVILRVLRRTRKEGANACRLWPFPVQAKLLVLLLLNKLHQEGVMLATSAEAERRLDLFASLFVIGRILENNMRILCPSPRPTTTFSFCLL
jgi:hypothetical protein